MVMFIMKLKTKKIIFLTLIFISIIVSTCYYFYNIKNIKNEMTVSNTLNEKYNKIAYLTFDDGPSKNTEKILNILDKYNIKVTFFVVGPKCNFKDELLKKIVKSGHSLAIHSYTHNYNDIYSSKENYLKDFYLCLEWIKEVTGIIPSIYRFPGGSSNTIASKTLIKDIIQELETKGFHHADWNVDTLDSYVKNEPSKVISNAMTSLKRNENNKHYYQTILMHDDIYKPATIDALPNLIEKIIAKGYRFKTLNVDSHFIQHTKV